MLVDVRSDGTFQRYLDREEDRLFQQLAPVLIAAVNIQVATNGVKAIDYVVKRGEPMLLRHYKRIYADQFRAVTTSEGKHVGDLIRKQDDDDHEDGPGLLAFLRAQLRALRERAGRHIRRIAESQRAAISARILRMTAEGKANNKITRELRDLAPEIGRNRAATIARTETHSSALKAIDETIRAKPRLKIKTKTWWANLDGRVRPAHAAAHGQEVPMDDPFDVDGEELQYPGDDTGSDENVINCRCSVLYNTEDEDEDGGGGGGGGDEDEEED